MKKSIWRFELEVTDEQTVQMPEGTVPLHLGWKAGVLHLWALVDFEAPRVERTVRIVGTGHTIDFPLPNYGGPIDPKADFFIYCGTVIEEGTGLVWHVWISR